MYYLGLFDISGQEDFDRLRPLSYSQTDVFVVCVNIENKRQFESAEKKWIPEITHHCPGVPYVLVGVIDPPEDFHEDSILQVTPAEMKAYGKALARRIGAWKYVQCNLHSTVQVKAVFIEVSNHLLYKRLTAMKISPEN